MFTFYSLGLICVIFHVLTYFLNICHVVDKFRLFARKSKIAKFQFFQKITQLQLKTCAIILYVSFFEQRKMFELNGPPKRHFWCSNMFLKSTEHLKTLFRTSEIGSLSRKKVIKSLLEPPN